MMIVRERIRRVIARTLTWRIVNISTGVLLTWLLTGSVTMGFGLAVIYNVARLGMHYVYERMWGLVGWGTLSYHEERLLGEDGAPLPPMERRLRTIIRTVTWRITGFAVATLIAFILTRDLRLSLDLGVLYAGALLVLHYAHDRYWSRFRWGTRFETLPASSDAKPHEEVPS